MATAETKQKAYVQTIELAKLYAGSSGNTAPGYMEMFLDQTYKKIIELLEDKDQAD